MVMLPSMQAQGTDGQAAKNGQDLVEGGKIAALERQVAADIRRSEKSLAHRRDVKKTLGAVRLRLQREELSQRQQAQRERDSQVHQEIVRLRALLDCLQSRAAELADQAAVKESKAMIDLRQRDERIADLEAECQHLQALAAAERDTAMRALLAEKYQQVLRSCTLTQSA